MASVSPQLSLGSFNCVRAWGASFVHHGPFDFFVWQPNALYRMKFWEGFCRMTPVEVSLLSVFQRGIVLSKLLKVWPTGVQVTR